MADPRAPIFDAVRPLARPGLFNDAGNVLALDNLLDAFDVPRADSPAIGHNQPPPARALTEPMVLEILEHEAIVREAYKDSRGVWTWGVGVTSESGHHVERYKDSPQSIAHCLGVYCWLLTNTYLPEVLRAFEGHDLAEHELGAALSFHYNTGAIGRASWVKSVLAGNRVLARSQIMDWTKNKELVGRRKAERDLFFDGRWSHDGIVTVWSVHKPSYTPRWSSADLLDVRDELREAMKEAA